MKQISFSQVGYAGKKRTTRREVFLAEMEQVMPWSEVLGVIEPHYPHLGVTASWGQVTASWGQI
jgi:IS5 family transposase